ncbi:hypothetical protein ACTFIZ_000988 [Dictyostelium cf. discoideum]
MDDKQKQQIISYLKASVNF